jgi:hypothetical protein
VVNFARTLEDHPEVVKEVIVPLTLNILPLLAGIFHSSIQSCSYTVLEECLNAFSALASVTDDNFS